MMGLFFLSVVLALVLYVAFRKPKKLVGKGEVIDSITLHNALRKQQGKPPLKVIDGERKR